MTIKTKLILLTGISLVITALVIGVFSILELKSAEETAIAEIEAMGADEADRIHAEGEKEIETFRNDLLNWKKEYLRSQVQTAIGILEKGYRDAHSFENLKEVYRAQLQNAVNTAFSILVAVEKETALSRPEKQAKAKSLIQALRYGSENKDYFWINDLGPTMVMHPYKPELNGQDLSGITDPMGKKLFVEFVKMAEEKDEGFVEYYWPKYGADQPQPKFSFVKLFKPWNWVIGTGVYLEVAEEELKKTSAETIGALRYGPENKDYFWINDLNHVMVMHPYSPELIGKELSGSEDAMGKKLFVEFVNTAKEQGEGFVEYHWSKYGSDQPEPKLSFVKQFKEWGWVLGTGIYIDDIHEAVQAEEQAIQDRVDTVKSDVTRRVNDTRKELSRKLSVIVFWMCAITVGILLVVLAVSFAYIQRSINKPIKRAVTGMTEAADQVASASGEVSAASQSLAEGASEQAASIEETSSSLEEMSSMTQRNATNSNQANILMTEANQVVQEANESMDQLTTSMAAIANASEETSKIIKTIDEIAFQTNLLALNAAVEAARAGEAGAGFAVVADEVRNLAVRAADAAKNTTELIKRTVTEIQAGSDLVANTNSAFQKVQQSTGKVGDLVGEIAAASSEQSQGIGQINSAVAEMDKVVQQNAASAEESASASEQMNAQAEEMKAIANEMMAMINGVKTMQRPTAKQRQAASFEEDFDESPPELIQPNSKATARSASRTEVRPEQLIPLDDEDLKDF